MRDLKISCNIRTLKAFIIFRLMKKMFLEGHNNDCAFLEYPK